MKKVSNPQKIIAVSKLIFRTFIGQPIGFIMSFVSPFILFIIIPYLMNGMMHTSMKATLEQIIPGLLLIPTVIISTLGIPIAYSALKENGILKKLNVAGITPKIFITSLLLVFLTIIVFSTFLMFSISKILWQSDSPNPSGASFLISWFFLMFVCIIIGLNIGNIAKSQALAFAIGVLSFLPVIFLAGIIFPEMDGWIAKISKALPQNHLTQLYKVAWYDNDLYLHMYHDGSINPITNSLRNISSGVFNDSTSDTIFAYTYSILFAILGTTVLTYTFKWE